MGILAQSDFPRDQQHRSLGPPNSLFAEKRCRSPGAMPLKASYRSLASQAHGDVELTSSEARTPAVPGAGQLRIPTWEYARADSRPGALLGLHDLLSGDSCFCFVGDAKLRGRHSWAPQESREAPGCRARGPSGLASAHRPTFCGGVPICISR